MNKIPLAQRLGQDNPYTAVAKLGITQLRDFFTSLGELRADGYYSDVYYGIIRETLENQSPVLDEETMFDDEPVSLLKDETSFAEAVAMIMNLPRQERANLLYHILIVPFTRGG